MRWLTVENVLRGTSLYEERAPLQAVGDDLYVADVAITTLNNGELSRSLHMHLQLVWHPYPTILARCSAMPSTEPIHQHPT